VRVPTLRNLRATAPYMHDGRFASLDAVLDHYERLAVDPPPTRACGARH
jgi:cytochrome c peroxidase